jgi:hypothetical protein
MRELPELLPQIAKHNGLHGGKVELAELLSRTARDSGMQGRRAVVSDATILQMERGACNDDERIRKLAFRAAVDNALVPFDDSILAPLAEIDAARCEAQAVVGAVNDPLEWAMPLADAERAIAPLKMRFDRYEQQIRDSFPEIIASGPRGSFNGDIWAAGVFYICASSPYALHSLADEVRYRISVLKPRAESVKGIKQWLGSIESEIGVGVDRVNLLHSCAEGFDEAAELLDQAAHRAGNDGYRIFCRYLAAKARGNARAVRSEIKDIAGGQRGYGGFGTEAVHRADFLDLEHERRTADIPTEVRRQHAVSDALLLTELRPKDHRPLRNVVYDAIRDRDVATVIELMQPLADTIGCDAKDVFRLRPEKFPQVLPLAEEPGLQSAFRECEDLAVLSGWRRRSASIAIWFGVAAIMAMLAGTGPVSAASLANYRSSPMTWLTSNGVGTSSSLLGDELAEESFSNRSLAARPGTDALGVVHSEDPSSGAESSVSSAYQPTGMHKPPTPTWRFARPGADPLGSRMVSWLSGFEGTRPFGVSSEDETLRPHRKPVLAADELRALAGIVGVGSVATSPTDGQDFQRLPVRVRFSTRPGSDGLGVLASYITTSSGPDSFNR